MIETQLTAEQDRRIDRVLALLERLEAQGARIRRVVLTRREIYQLGGGLGIAAHGFRFRGHAVRIIDRRD